MRRLKNWIRRHPHVFGEVSVGKTRKKLLATGKRSKRRKLRKGRKSILDGIPATLPVLARAQKVISKIRALLNQRLNPLPYLFQSEEELGDKFWQLIEAAEEKGWSVEDLLRRATPRREQEFREKTPEMSS